MPAQMELQHQHARSWEAYYAALRQQERQQEHAAALVTMKLVVRNMKLCFDGCSGGMARGAAPTANLMQVLRAIGQDAVLYQEVSNIRDGNLLKAALASLYRSSSAATAVAWEDLVHALSDSLSRAEADAHAAAGAALWRRVLAASIPRTAAQAADLAERAVQDAFSLQAYKRKLGEELPADLAPAKMRTGSIMVEVAGERAVQKLEKERRPFEATRADNDTVINELQQMVERMALEREQSKAAQALQRQQQRQQQHLTPAEAVAMVEARIAAKVAEEAAAAAAAAAAPALALAARLAVRLQPLTPDQEVLVDRAFVGADSEVVADAYAATLSRGSLKRVRGLQWLNDEVINMYMQLLLERDKSRCTEDPQLRRSHFFNSYFLSKLTENSYNYPGVRRWTKKAKVDIFTLDKVIMPANVGNMHWCLAVIYVQERRIQYYDSMGGRGTTFLNALERWLEDEHKDKKGGPLGATWTKVPTIDGTPQQENGCDCGVFTCMFADYISENLPLQFGQDHMQHFRRSLALQLLQGKAL